VKAAYDAFGHGGFAALADHLAALQRVLDHAPKGFQVVQEGPTEVVYGGREMGRFLALSAEIQAQAKAAGQSPKAVTWRQSPYPEASLLIGSYYNEQRQWDRALPILQRGLKLSPADPKLVTETGSTLCQSRRCDQALPLYAQILATDPVLSAQDRARILRAQGYALTELNRLDAAEQAYNDSLKFEPDHQGARHELAYIAHLRAGAAPAAGVLSTADKARKGEY